MEKITTERKDAILKKYDSGDHALFNWCDEYNNYISSSVNLCVTLEVEYILKASIEDKDAPFSYDDLDLFDNDKAREHILYKYDSFSIDEKSLLRSEVELCLGIKINKSNLSKSLDKLDKDQLKNIFSELDLDTYNANAEIFQWFIVSEPLIWGLKEQGEIILNDYYWGRQCCGQHISLDSVCITAFIEWLKDLYTSPESKGEE